MKYNSAIRRRAVSLREQGKSYKEIQAALGIPKSTLSSWLKQVPLNKVHRKRLYNARVQNLALGVQSSRERRRREVENILEEAANEIRIPLTMENRMLFGAALYWAEGTKKGLFEITNSDPLLVFFMVRWIHDVFNIKSKQLRAKINMYAQQNEEELKHFWSDLCGIPVENFRKSYIKPRAKNVKRNTLYYGTIKIMIPRSTDLKYRVFGWIEGVMREDKKCVEGIKRRWEHLEQVERPVNLP